jgi:hypothetical protein
MKTGTRFWTLAVMVGAVELLGLSIGAPRVQALIEGTGAETVVRTGRELASVAWSHGTNAATSVAAPLLAQAIRSATTLLAMVDRVAPERALPAIATPEPVFVAVVPRSMTVEHVVVRRCVTKTLSAGSLARLHELEGCQHAARMAARAQVYRLRAERIRLERADLERVPSGYRFYFGQVAKTL